MLLLLALACTDPEPVDTGPTERPWTREVPPLDLSLRDRTWQRGIIHLHSPWSHDACDGEGILDGEPNAQCVVDFREGLCVNALDFAFVTDHPSYMAWQEYRELLWIEEGDEELPNANRMLCPDGHEVVLMPGYEDDLMAVGLDAHQDGTIEDRDAAYTTGTGETIQTARDLGGAMLINHTEGRELADLEVLQDAGLTGVEAFNLHAMVDPNIRKDDLGLDAYGWVSDVADFLDPYAPLTSDLVFLGIVQHQEVSEATWDALSARGPSVGVAGTDAHRNALPMLMADEERVDSYRRMNRWFSNWLLTDSDGPEDLQEALEAGRNLVVFDVFGRPAAPDVHAITEGGDRVELGGTTSGGTLSVSCPRLSTDSPRGPQAPEFHVVVLRDGETWAVGCGEHTLDGPGVYRVAVDITPWHLVDFLDGEEDWIHRVPWLLFNPLHVEPGPS